MENKGDVVRDAYLDATAAALNNGVPGANSKADLVELLKHQQRIAHALSRLQSAYRNQNKRTPAEIEAIATCENGLSAMHDLIVSRLAFDPLRTQPSPSSGSKAEEVFAIPELAEIILLELSPYRLLQAMLTCKTLASTISSPSASPKLQVKLGLRPHAKAHYSTPFADETEFYEIVSEVFQGPDLGDNLSVSLVRTREAWDNALKTGQATVRAQFATERNADQEEGVRGPPDKVGERARAMLICQPPIKEMRIKASCCRRHVHCFETVQNVDGVTVGDLLDSLVWAVPYHKQCPEAAVRRHSNRTGVVKFGICFEGTVQLRKGDPCLPTAMKDLHDGESDEPGYEDDSDAGWSEDDPPAYRGPEGRTPRSEPVMAYVRWKRAHHRDAKLLTMAEWLSADYLHLWADRHTGYCKVTDVAELEGEEGYYYDFDKDRRPEDSRWAAYVEQRVQAKRGSELKAEGPEVGASRAEGPGGDGSSCGAEYLDVLGSDEVLEYDS